MIQERNQNNVHVKVNKNNKLQNLFETILIYDILTRFDNLTVNTSQL